MRYLGIDYGSKNVGIAISDDKAMMAFPHSVVPNNKNLLANIAEVARRSEIRTIIIGESKNYKGEDNRIMKDITPFAASLQNIGYEVILEPELLSSHQAAHFQGKTDKIDAAAASIILQSYLDRKRNLELNHALY